MHTPSSDNYTLHIIKNKEELRFKTKIPRLNVLKLALIISCVYSEVAPQKRPQKNKNFSFLERVSSSKEESECKVR